MATYRAVSGAMNALRQVLEDGIGELAEEIQSPRVEILGTQDLRGQPTGHVLGLYLHRIAVDPQGRNRYLPPRQPGAAPRPELPLNLHLLVLGWSRSRSAETTLVAWAMQRLGAALELNARHLGTADPDWTAQENLQVLPEAMTSAELMGIWATLPGTYRLSCPYLIKTLRVAPTSETVPGPPVTSIVLPVEAL